MKVNMRNAESFEELDLSSRDSVYIVTQSKVTGFHIHSEQDPILFLGSNFFGRNCLNSTNNQISILFMPL